MLTKSPSGALSPYYYKGGYFHGIHYGSYFDDVESFLSIMLEEENFILSSPQRRRIIIDLYETNLTKSTLDKFVTHIERIKERIVKLAISCEKKKLLEIKKALYCSSSLEKGLMYFTPDMEDGKTWLVSDRA